ncbi:MAG: hypothetical protein GC208_10525 [Alphaproteobacteria bacterium]|nr:hypothetical protein [Alphaproteobacteria bacterium]
MRVMITLFALLFSTWVAVGNAQTLQLQQLRLDSDGNGSAATLTESSINSLTAASHQPVTLSSDASGLLSISGQTLDLPTTNVVINRSVTIDDTLEVSGAMNVLGASQFPGATLGGGSGVDATFEGKVAILDDLTVSSPGDVTVDGGNVVVDGGDVTVDGGTLEVTERFEGPGLVLDLDGGDLSFQISGRPDFSSMDTPGIEIGTTGPFTVRRDGDTIATLGASGLSLVTALPITSGGTGSTSASAARTALGLGTIATQAADAVAITGGTITTSGAGSRISATSTNTTAAIAMQNYSGGPAASFATSGATPFTVNSQTKVAFLNADLLDGIDSAALMPRQFAVISVGTPTRLLTSTETGSVIIMSDELLQLPTPAAGLWYTVLAQVDAQVEATSGGIVDPGGVFNGSGIYASSDRATITLVCDGSYWIAVSVRGTWGDL